VEDFSDGLDCNVTITSEADGTYMFFGHGGKVATWMCGDKEDDLQIHGISREPNPKKGYLRKEEEWEKVVLRV
jgi:hypothetical protein